MRGLTARQYAIGAFIAQHTAAYGFSPTLREIAAHMGISSTNGVNDHLRALEHKGFVVRDDMKSRTLRLTPKWFALVERNDVHPVERVATRRALAPSLVEAARVRASQAESTFEHLTSEVRQLTRQVKVAEARATFWQAKTEFVLSRTQGKADEWQELMTDAKCALDRLGARP